MEKIKVFIVDDDNMLIDGIAKFFRESKTLEYLGRANTPNECLKKLQEYVQSIDIILMDVKFPQLKMDGIQLAKKIRNMYPGKIPRIVFTTIGNRAIADPENGFHGLIPKNQGMIELMKMLEDIYYKDTVYPSPLEEDKNFFNKLTKRQKTIFCLTLKEKKMEKIAVELEIETSTVRNHQKAIISKIQKFGIDANQITDPLVKNLAKKYNFCDYGKT